MQKVILDTNLLVSAIIQRIYPHFVVDSVLENTSLSICVSPELLAEYHSVLNRDKFSRFPDFHVRAKALMEEIRGCSRLYVPKVRRSIIGDDGDNRLPELAEAAHADFLITGNHNDFNMRKHGVTLIVSPREYWEEHQPPQ